jgi:hypothetical protein
LNLMPYTCSQRQKPSKRWKTTSNRRSLILWGLRQNVDVQIANGQNVNFQMVTIKMSTSFLCILTKSNPTRPMTS